MTPQPSEPDYPAFDKQPESDAKRIEKLEARVQQAENMISALIEAVQGQSKVTLDQSVALKELSNVLLNKWKPLSDQYDFEPGAESGTLSLKPKRKE